MAFAVHYSNNQESLALFPDFTLPMCAKGADVSGEVTEEGWVCLTVQRFKHSI